MEVRSRRSIATAFAPNDTAFIIFMAMEGLGSACNTPTAIGIFSAHFPPGPKRNMAYGALGAGQAVGFIIGLVLGASHVSIDAGYLFADCFRRYIDGKFCYMASDLFLSSWSRVFLRYPGMDGPRERADSATLHQGHRLGRCCSKYSRFRAYDLQSRVRTLCPTVIFKFSFANQDKTGILPRHEEVGPPHKFRACCLYHLCFSHFSYIMSTGERPETSPY